MTCSATFATAVVSPSTGAERSLRDKSNSALVNSVDCRDARSMRFKRSRTLSEIPSLPSISSVVVAIPVDERGQLVGVTVERGGELSHFVVREVNSEFLGFASTTHRLHALGEIGNRTHHTSGKPTTDKQG